MEVEKESRENMEEETIEETIVIGDIERQESVAVSPNELLTFHYLYTSQESFSEPAFSIAGSLLAKFLLENAPPNFLRELVDTIGDELEESTTPFSRKLQLIEKE